MVAKELHRRRVPFIYTPQFEGGELDPGVLTVGETAEDLLPPGLSWLATEKRASRFFLLGNNYVWPIKSMDRARRIITDMGCSVVGNSVVPFEVEDHEQLMARIVRARPHVVVSWLLGHEAVIFNRAFAASGLASRILRFSTSIDETILYAIGETCTENLYVASHISLAFARVTTMCSSNAIIVVLATRRRRRTASANPFTRASIASRVSSTPPRACVHRI